MYFRHALDALLAVLKERIRNGELTERGLARRVGLSQSHIHNVLKGVRILTPEVADQILQEIQWELEDLLERGARRKPPQSATEPDGNQALLDRATSR